jgi:hypothetical protein
MECFNRLTVPFRRTSVVRNTIECSQVYLLKNYRIRSNLLDVISHGFGVEGYS